MGLKITNILFIHAYIIDDVVSWNIFFNYFVFKLDDREEGGGWFYIIRFKDGKITQTRLKDVFNDSSCKYPSPLYLKKYLVCL